MVKIFLREKDRIVEVESPVKDCWVNIVPPFNMDDLQALSLELEIPFSFIVDCIDIYERSRYEREDDIRLIVINTPIINDNLDIDDEASFITVPVGIILTPDKIVTISSIANPMIDWFEKNTIKNLRPEDRNMFVLRIFERNVTYYLHYLREINRRIGQIEKELYQSGRNQDLKRLLNHQKSLVYFLNDLRANEMVMMKIQRTNFLSVNEDEDMRDLLQDIVIDNSQAIEMAHVYTTILKSTMDAMASMISNTLNAVMSRLTSITLALMVPTLVASYYGMNVDFLPFIHHKLSFWIIFVVSIMLSGTLMYFFKRNKWL
jgi:magnesium transporter